MRRLTVLITVVSLLAVGALLGACASSEEREARNRGIERARRDIEAGRPHLLYTGLPSPDASPLDPETGLPRHSRGCVVSDTGMAEEDGYNDTVLDALANGELDHLTLRHKVTTHAALAERFVDGGGTNLTFESEPALAPSGRYEITLAERDIPGSDTPYVFVTDTESGRRSELIYIGEPKARVLFDHDGTTLLIRDDHYQRFVTYDLPQVLQMQVFVDADRAW